VIKDVQPACRNLAFSRHYTFTATELVRLYVEITGAENGSVLSCVPLTLDTSLQVLFSFFLSFWLMFGSGISVTKRVVIFV
jgi:hypothetical protein